MSIERQILEALEELTVYGNGPDGKPRALGTDGYGRLRVAAGPPSLFDKDIGGLTKKLVRGNPCYLTRIVATNVNVAVRYMNIFDKDTAPAATDVPTGQGISLAIPGGTTNNPGVLSIELGETHRMNSGLAWAVSTTNNLFTDAATVGEHSVHVWYTLLTPRD